MIETKYHTATHLLNAALKQVIGKDVHQKGSNITVDRLRFDFSCDHKLSDEEVHVETGVFGEDMKVSLINDGPITIEWEYPGDKLENIKNNNVKKEKREDFGKDLGAKKRGEKKEPHAVCQRSSVLQGS